MHPIPIHRLAILGTLALCCALAACGDGGTDSTPTPRPRSNHWGDRATLSVRDAERRVGGFDANDRAQYRRGVQHIINLHERIGAFTIAQVVDQEESRERQRDDRRKQVAARAAAAAEAKRRAVAEANGPRTVTAGCNAFSARINGIEGIGQVVKSWSCSGEDRDLFKVDVTINDEAWRTFDYDERLRLAKSLWEGAVHAARFESKPDSARIKLIGQAGEDLGGSNWLAGSMIDVSKD